MNTKTDLQGQFAEKTAAVKQRAQSASQSGKEQFAAAAGPVWDAAPEPVRQAVAKGASEARQRRVPIAAAVGALILGLLLLRKLRGR